MKYAFKNRIHLHYVESIPNNFLHWLTNDLRIRVWQHLNNEGSAFVKNKLFDLVYYEHFDLITDAINREKQLKNWHHEWKVNLIKSVNPLMKDLKPEIGE